MNKDTGNTVDSWKSEINFGVFRKIRVFLQPIFLTMKIFAVIFFSILLLPDIYVRFVFLRKKKWPWRLLNWLPTLVAILCALVFWGTNIPALPLSKAFFYILICIALPKLVFMAVSILFRLIRIFWKGAERVELPVSLACTFVALVVMIYGSTVGQKKLVVNEQTLTFSNLPQEFDGYRIVQLSDFHIGTFGKDTSFVARVVAEVMAQKPDMIVFTGDLVNSEAAEVEPFIPLLSSLSAPDGVLSIFGNHDYCYYSHHNQMDVIEREQEALKANERKLGWQLLLNEHRVVERDSSRIAIVGVENIGRPPFPHFGSLPKAMNGLSDSTFVILLSHDPSHWRMEVLPDTDIPLTLSGHTHAMQFRIGNLTPVRLKYPEWGGQYEEGGQQLFVSTGVGGNIPFRFGAWPEICVLTLRCR
jgi:predicted MPP superfamily phosphohydrolase